VGASLLQIASQVLPVVTNALQDLVGWWEKLSPGMQKAIIYAGMIVVAIGPLLVAIGTLISAFCSIISFGGSFITILGSLASFIPTVVAALGLWPILIGAAAIAVVTLIVTHWNQITAFLTGATNTISTALKAAWE